MSLLTILLIVLVACAIFGGVGHGRFGTYGWSPLGLVVLIVIVLLLTGRLR